MRDQVDAQQRKKTTPRCSLYIRPLCCRGYRFRKLMHLVRMLTTVSKQHTRSSHDGLKEHDGTQLASCPALQSSRSRQGAPQPLIRSADVFAREITSPASPDRRPGTWSSSGRPGGDDVKRDDRRAQRCGRVAG